MEHVTSERILTNEDANKLVLETRTSRIPGLAFGEREIVNPFINTV